MSDEALEETARRWKWDKRAVARLTDAAYTVMQLRTFAEHMRRRLGNEEGTLARRVLGEVDAYVWPTIHHAEGILSEYGADVGNDSDVAMALWQGLSRVFYRVPDGPENASGR